MWGWTAGASCRCEAEQIVRQGKSFSLPRYAASHSVYFPPYTTQACHAVQPLGAKWYTEPCEFYRSPEDM